MTDKTLSPNKTEEKRPIFGDIVARDVSAEAYMEQYAEGHHEWIDGVVIKMSPISREHELIGNYFRQVLDTYLALQPIGNVHNDPFVMFLEVINTRRQPDLQIILKDNLGELTATAMKGPADICIEIVSPASTNIDYGEKFAEYEKGGVREYWIIDPIRKNAQFYRLDDEGLYKPSSVDSAGDYESPLLPKLKINVPTLWQEELPDIIVVVTMVQAMIGQTET
jgi:Uma2 family endonuclease